MHELSSAHLVVLEIPPVVTVRFEHDLLSFVQKLLALNLTILALVQPSLRRRSNKTLWVHKWNRLTHIPFKFYQTCSCKTGDQVRGCHLTYYIGCNKHVSTHPCSDVPTLSTSPQASLDCLGGTIKVLTSQLLSGLPESVHLSVEPAICCPVSEEARSQQTPDSAVTQGSPRGSGYTEPQAAYPTDSKEKEKARRKAEKEAGIERPVQRRQKVMEDHYDDCGDDLSSLQIEEIVGLSNTCFDQNEALSDEDHDRCMMLEFRTKVQSYPVDESKVAKARKESTPAHGPDPRAPLGKDSTCPGCKHARARTDWEHTREVGQCKFPYDDPWIPQCIACQSRKPRWHVDHQFDEMCKWGQKDQPPDKRRSDRPHEPKLKAHKEPTAGIPATVDGQELGQAAEEQVAQEDARGSDSTEPSSSSSAGPRQSRGQDLVPRNRRVWRDQGDNPENPHDWTNFDIGRVVRLFRTNREGAIRLSLRKLHVRWWHASEHVMKRFLDRVGVAERVLELIPEIVQTCKVCREWAKPGPDNVCSVEIPDKFNDQVECDLLFVHKYIIFHMLCRCTRWHAARVIPNKESETLMKAIEELWVSTHGPMRELITDGEGGIVMSDRTTQYLARKGIKLCPRGKDQHARYIERRGALIRDAIHRVEGQLEEEGVVGIPFECKLSEAVFCGNALLTVGGSSPYNALYGRVPRMLPSIDQIENPGEVVTLNPGLIAHTHTGCVRLAFKPW